MIANVPKRNQRKLKWKRRGKYFGVGMILTGGLLLLVYAWFYGIYRERVYPGVRVGPVEAAAMKESTLRQQLITYFEVYQQKAWPEKVVADGKEFKLPGFEESIKVDWEATGKQALRVGRNGPLHRQLWEQWQGIKGGWEVPLMLEKNEQLWAEWEASVAAQVNVEAQPPRAGVKRANGKAEVEIFEGTAGKEARVNQFVTDFMSKLAQFENLPRSIPIRNVNNTATQNELEGLKNRAEFWLGKTLVLNGKPEAEWTEKYEETEIIAWLTTSGYNEASIAARLRQVAEKVEREPQNATLKFDEAQKRAVEFVPAVNGLKLARLKTQDQIKQILEQSPGEAKEIEANLVFEVTEPEVTLARVNDLGIKERIGRGYSTFTGSINTRVHNVDLAASRVNGTLIPPGETFSFNAAVGEVNGATGYQKAYVIKNGRTELDDGGGVCQVSTTVFRAALNAGLPITERRAHAYRVGYYEQNAKAGLDATVYSPTTDFKFINDTPGHILVQSTVAIPTRELTIDFYGTRDGRESKISNHTVGSIVPPPEDIYQDDPTLPTGTIKQVEHKVAGAKAKFDYTVSRNNEVVFEKTFHSVYKPWAAVYLKGVGPTP